MNERLICPYCGQEQMSYELDNVSVSRVRIRCEHCGRRFWYTVKETREYTTQRDRGADRYQVITYDEDCGSDEKLEYQTLVLAIRVAKGYVDGTGPLADGLKYDGAIVYDLKYHRIVREYGYLPDWAKPTQGPAKQEWRKYV